MKGLIMKGVNRIRAHKRAFLISAAAHAVFLFLLLFAPDVRSRNKPNLDKLPPVQLVPAQVVDNSFAGGRQAAPKPKKQEKTEPEPQPEPKPKPEPKPEPESESEPKPKPEPKSKPEPEPEAEPITPNLDKTQRQTSKPTRKTPEPNLKRTTRSSTSSSDVSEAIQRIEKNLSSNTRIQLNGAGSSAAVNYAQFVRRAYERAWTPPSQIQGGRSRVKIRVTIARNGRVASSRLVQGSGNSAVDQSVRRALQRVNRIKAFPSEISGSQKTFTINFKLEAQVR